MKNLTQNIDKIINLICSFFTYLALLIYFKIIYTEQSFNFIMTLVFFGILVFYNKENKQFNRWDKRSKKITNIYSMFLSIILIVGSIVSEYIKLPDTPIFGFKNIFFSLYGIIGFWLLFRILIMKILKCKINIQKNNFKIKFNNKHFIICMCLMVLCWLPYFLRFYPGIMSPDSYHSINYVNNGILSDHHTFGHTWFFGFFYLIGKSIFSNSNSAIAFYIIIQMFINAFMFTKIIKFLWDRKVNKVVITTATLFLFFSPLYAFYSITLWRDILFGCSFILLFISLYEFIENEYKFTKLTLINYIIAILFILFFRNNGIYVFISFIPFLIAFSKKNKKFLTITHITIIILYFVIKGPIFNYFNVSKSRTVESYSIPLQQIARVVMLDLEIDKKDYEYLNSVIYMDKVGESYKPHISDPIKDLVNSEKLAKTKFKFLKVWFNLLIKHPITYVESYLCQTLGYWYPDVVYWSVAGEGKSTFDDDVYSDPILKDYLVFLDHNSSKELPLSNLIWSLGTMVIIFSFSIMLLIYKKEYRYLLCYAPIFCLWLTLMIASPVFCELRYIYGLFTSIILIIVCPFLKKKSKI